VRHAEKEIADSLKYLGKALRSINRNEIPDKVGNRVFVANFVSNTVLVIDGNTNTVVTTKSNMKTSVFKAVHLRVQCRSAPAD